jgi:hypothetical protein
MVGFFVVVGDWDNIIITVALFFMIYIPKIREEEAYLVQKFGTAWTDYVARVPQLFPHRIVTTQLFDDWRLGRWLANREYNAVVGTYLGLMSMQTWHDVSSWLS